MSPDTLAMELNKNSNSGRNHYTDEVLTRKLIRAFEKSYPKAINIKDFRHGLNKNSSRRCSKKKKIRKKALEYAQVIEKKICEYVQIEV